MRKQDHILRTGLSSATMCFPERPRKLGGLNPQIAYFDLLTAIISEAAVPEREEKEEKPDEDEDKASFAVKSTTKAVVPTRWESKVRPLVAMFSC